MTDDTYIAIAYCDQAKHHQDCEKYKPIINSKGINKSLATSHKAQNFWNIYILPIQI